MTKCNCKYELLIQRVVWLSGNTLAGWATVGGSSLDKCSKICKVSKPGSQHWKIVARIPRKVVGPVYWESHPQARKRPQHVYRK